MPDYIMRWLASRFIEDTDYLESLGILTDEVRAKKEAQQAFPIEDTNGHSNGEGNGNGHSNGEAKANGVSEAEAEAKPATAALTDTPPVVPAKMGADLELGPGLRPVRRHDAAHRLLLHVLELRQQHRLRLVGSRRTSSSAERRRPRRFLGERGHKAA